MNDAGKEAEWLLLMDTCGEGAGVGVSVGETVVAEEILARGGGPGGVSAEILGAVERVLAGAGRSLAELNAIAVVSGPGSFTGVRVGMGAAKGLSEATGLPMIAVSRLEVLAGFAARGLAALDAGRGECYVRDSVGKEWLVTVEALSALAQGIEVTVAEERVSERLRGAGVAVRERALGIRDMLPVVLRAYREGNESMVLADANYVRREMDLYKGGQ